MFGSFRFLSTLLNNKITQWGFNQFSLDLSNNIRDSYDEKEFILILPAPIFSYDVHFVKQLDNCLLDMRLWLYQILIDKEKIPPPCRS